ncbi:HtaA domain-containing protein [Leucobacter chinensis]|uniref:HtaA domain-containing protein n=1 Tax=Leucobacter chinensis TaxID=2851010 RepID=UPI001C21ADF3|nr:HtaA domain-containing protein [Leucobacter chinensis]
MRRTKTVRLGRKIGVLGVALMLSLGWAAPASAAEAQGNGEGSRVEIVEGSLDWGVRYSIRNYLENFGHTEGYVAAFDGATYRKGNEGALFPVQGGWVNVERGQAELEFGGRMKLYGFGTPWLHFDGVRLSIDGGKATITVDMIESFGTKTQTPDLELAVFDLAETPMREQKNGSIVIESDEGEFPPAIGNEHLPRQDGDATYGGDNNYTDGFSFTLWPEGVTAPHDGDSDEDEEDNSEENQGKVPETPKPEIATPEPTAVAKPDAYGESTAQNQYGASLTVSPAYSLADTEQTVHLKGTGFPTTAENGSNFGGLYVLFGWIDPASGDTWGPGHRGVSGKTFTYSKDIEPAGTFQSMVSYPGNTTVPGFPMMDSAGNFEMDLPLIASRFESQHGIDIDCYRMQCGVMLIGAHGQKQAKGEIFVPVYFTDTQDATGSEVPDVPVSAPVTANPNMVSGGAVVGGAAGQNTGLGVNGGLVFGDDGTSPRTAFFAGILLLSGAALSAAVLMHRRRNSLTRKTSLSIPTTIESKE